VGPPRRRHIADGLRALARLCRIAGFPEGEAYECEQRYVRVRDALVAKCWDEEAAAFWDLSGLRSETPQKVLTFSIFFPIILPDLDRKIVRALVERHLLNEKEFWLPYPIPTVAATEPSFDPAWKTNTTWRGPTWVNVNWYLYWGLRQHGFEDVAEELRSRTISMIASGGVREFFDPRTAADMLAERTDWVEALEKGIRAIKEKRGLDLIVIDSLEALEVLAKFKDRRREMYRLFEWLRDLAVTSFVITERPDWLIAGHVLQGRWDEDFLADGVIQLRIHMVSDLEAQRRLRVVKMRGTKHETGYLAMVLDDGRFRVTRAMST